MLIQFITEHNFFENVYNESLHIMCLIESVYTQKISFEQKL